MNALDRELEITLESALLLSDEDTSLPVLAERIYASETALIAQFQRQWTIERLLWMLKRRRSKIAVSQLPLPGFEKLPRRITVKGGRRAALRFATLRELKEYRAVLWQRQDARVKPLDVLIEVVASYAVENPDIRAIEAMEKEAARRQR